MIVSKSVERDDDNGKTLEIVVAMIEHLRQLSDKKKREMKREIDRSMAKTVLLLEKARKEKEKKKEAVKAHRKEDSDDDETCVCALEELENGFDFQLTPRADKRCKDLGVRHRTFVARVIQHGSGSAEDLKLPRVCLPHQLEKALQRAIKNIISADGEVAAQDDLFIYMSSDRLRSAYNSRRSKAEEWQKGSGAAKEILSQMSQVLNSNEHFSLDDTFTQNVANVKEPGKGGDRVGLGSQPIDQLLDGKRSIIRINNTDELCLARALVTMKAFADGGVKEKDYLYLRNGRAIQTTRAQALHQEAGVPLGPCGLEEVKKFQNYLTDYQIVVLSKEHGGHPIYKGPDKPEDKRLIVLKVGEHYHGCTKVCAFIGKRGLLFNL